MNREILRLAIPNIISNLTVPLVGMVDMALMGRMGSPVFIGAIALGSVIFSVIYMGFGFLRMGTTGFTAQAFGRNNKTQSSYTLYRALLIAGLIAVLLLLFQRPIEWFSFLLLDGSDEAKALAAKYFYVRIWAAPATLSLYAFMGWFVGMQNTMIPMYIAIAINVINLLLNILFVVYLGMDVDGVALGTVLAQYSGLLLALAFYFKKFKGYNIRLQLKALLDKAELQPFFRVNTDIFIRTMLLIMTLSFFTSKSAGLGDDMLAINSIMLQFFFLFSYFMDGFAYAGEALTGKYIGAGNRKQLIKTVTRLFLWGGGLSMPFVIAYGLFPKPLFGLLTTNLELINQSDPFHIWLMLLPLTTFAAFIWDGVFVGATASRGMRNSMAMASLLVFIPAWYFLTPIMGNHGLWLAFHLFMICRALAMSVMGQRILLSKMTN